MRKVSMATRAELILAIRERYASAGRPERAKIALMIELIELPSVSTFQSLLFCASRRKP
jgi:hypothetical protein